MAGESLGAREFEQAVPGYVVPTAAASYPFQLSGASAERKRPPLALGGGGFQRALAGA